MSTGDTAVGQKATSRSAEAERAPGRWRQEQLAAVKMSALGSPEGPRQPHVDPEQLGNMGSSQLFSSGKLASPGEAAPQAPEKQYAPPRPSLYSRPHPLAFPQAPLPLGAMHGGKPPQSLEGPPWLFPGHLPSVASEDLFPFPLHGHSAAYPRKKISSLNPAYGQYSQKSLEQPEDVHKKEHKPKKPGKYICPYCSRACAKPSVLKKHIRSHTGERPYPCIPCGFSFKTKSNLYKHRKSHAHAIKAGLVPFTESAVSKLDLEAGFIDVEAEIHSDGEQSTDTDEESSLFVEAPDKMSPGPPMPGDVAGRGGYPGPLDESLGGPMKVPVLIIPKSGLPLPSESPQYLGSDVLPNPSLKADDSHTVKQKLALRLSEKKGHDAEPSLNLLSPHSKGSTDSGYFSRSESAEQQISPPNTNAKSYEEIIFGKFCRLNPRNVLSIVAASEERAAVGRKGVMEPLPHANARLDLKMFEDPASQLLPGQGDLDPGHTSLLKSPKFNSEPRHSQPGPASSRNEGKLYPAHFTGSGPILLEAPVDSSPLIRSNSMPTSSATNLSIPPSLRGSHSFDERMAGSDDVFYPGTVGLPPQRMLRRQAAFELPSVQEGHVEVEHHGRVPKSTAGPSLKEKKLGPAERGGYDYDVSWKPYKKWDDPDVPKQLYRDVPCLTSLKHGGEFSMDPSVAGQGLPILFGMTCETRKRRKEKSVGDEEDTPMVCGGVGGTPLGLGSSDYDPKMQVQEGAHGHTDPGGSQPQSGSPSLGSEDSPSATDSDRTSDLGGRKPPGNVISVIQHTNSLSRPNSFERSESAELAAGAQDKTSSPSETGDSEVSEAPVSPEWAPPGDGADSGVKPSPSPQGLQPPCHTQPRLVRQHNIQVPEIRVTEEPDKPEKEKETQGKEPEKPAEEFQWPQRSETLSQLPAEKLPPKKKRLRLAEMEHSSGESSFESAGTGLSRSPSQESNLSHSSSFSMSFERDEAIKLAAFPKQDELGKPSEFLTVPAGSYSLSVPGHPQKEMRRSSSEQTPCPHPAEVPEIRSKSFDYGNLSHAPAAGAVAPTLSPPRERKRCFLVRQASFSGSPEMAQGEASGEQGVQQEQMEQLHASLRSAWPLCPSSVLPAVASEDLGKQSLGTCAQLGAGSFHLAQRQILHLDSPEALRNPLMQPTSYVTSKHLAEQPHLFPPQETVPFSPMQNPLFQFQYPTVSMVRLPAQQLPWWQVPFPPPLAPHPPKSYDKPPFQSEAHAGYPVEPASEHAGKEPSDYAHTTEHAYPCYSGTSGLHSKSLLPPFPSDQSAKPSSPPTEQLLPEDFASARAGPLQSLPGPVVPVRIQTHVPSYGSVMYTSISQMLGHSSPAIVICKVNETTTERTLVSAAATQGLGLDIAQVLGQHAGLEKYPIWKVPQTLPLGLESSIPLCLPSTSDGASSLGGSKRMLSPASSLELFMETKQQKRVKEEKMYGQIVKELSAVELTSSDIKKHLTRPPKPQLVRQGCASEPKDGSHSRSSSFSSLSPSSSQDQPPAREPFTPAREPLASARAAPVGQRPVGPSESKESSDELEIDEAASDMSMSPQGASLPPGDLSPKEPGKSQKLPTGVLLHVASGPGGKAANSTFLFTDVADFQQLLQFPSLRTTTTVSWCFLNYTKPNCVQQAAFKSSVYASWCISSCNPNPSGLNTKTTLALLRSKQKITAEVYTLAAMHRPGSGKLTSSSAWKQFAQMKPDASFLFGSKLERKLVGNTLKERGKGDFHGDKDIGSKQTEPIRIKIFEGGYKSNEEYVYVRGRGRGKYICEECGIRCKKPSMLKKHIRTHTDVRPYICKLCNFAFKTKGNLTKHMKSKAHMKKCLELGVSMTSVDDTETEEAENMEELHKAAEKHSMSSISTDHQFSDAEESDGEDGDDNDDDDEDDDDFDDQGDLTPKTRSRSTSPQPPRFSSLPVNVGAAPHGGPSEGSLAHPSLMSYLVTLPSIQVTQLMTPSDSCEDTQMTAYQRLFQSRSTDSEPDKDRLSIPSCMEEDCLLSSEPGSSPRDFSPASHHSSPGYDSSPCRDNSPKRYLMPKGDLSPRRHLSPRRELSPLRHLSPRKEAALRREMSQRDASPRRHLSPRRPVSPGKDVMARRDLSPRRDRRYKTSVRAPSPRRALYPNPPLSLGQYLQAEPILLGPPSFRRGPPQVPYFSLYGDQEGAFEHQGSGLAPEAPTDHVFSHLPLHSQLQVRAPVPMVPVGGIQLVHSMPPALPGFHPPPTLPLPMEGSEEKRGASGEPFAKEPPALSRLPGLQASGRPCAASSPRLLMKQSTSEDSLNAAEREQEDNIQTCTKAIASLRIAAEEAPLLGADAPARGQEPPQKPWESAHAGIRHFSGAEPGPPCPAAAHLDLQDGEKDAFGTSQTASAHSTFYSRSGGDDKQPGFPSSQELPPSTEERREPSPSEKSRLH
ncbi:transcription factor HIVEP2 [Choloepus didactylus]|uniref:transcription factor HIVEP2 n=1 Tax=Choloepus didactylus TaxID=27675 RepID=UPI00189FBDE2|nr:transcription factor HIVEP2 [Choloepus didactylus]XP_037698050.1 transcription factor HIVEP2 [Choloepus didactylus]XP_037698051.1 transcription factor HIVEP2 [Choloepus didactylus]XP_037698052.1 transcription factor HIVEP2 [Choloepus didactylus]XP_037698053.1 transcription factor HIVEP2 [Choloepus didactylus]XP_037698054.1 transcription factor HIVEP2 [Choloepus didactylus]